MAPRPSADILQQLQAEGKITPETAQMGGVVPAAVASSSQLPSEIDQIQASAAAPAPASAPLEIEPLTPEAGVQLASAQASPQGQVPNPSTAPAPAIAQGQRQSAQAPGAVKLTTDASPGNTVQVDDGMQNNLGMQATRAGVDAMTAQQRVLDQAGQDAMVKATQEAKYLETLAKEQQKALDQQQIAEAERQKQWDEAQKKLNQAQQEFGKSGVDPQRYFKNMGTGEKILTAISIFLGGFDPKGNKVTEFLQNAVDADIDAQKQEIAVKRDAVNTQQNLMGEMMRRFGDQRLAESATRIAYNDMIQTQIKANAAKYAGADAQRNAQTAILTLEQEKAKQVGEFAKNYELMQAEKRIAGGGAQDMGATPQSKQIDADLMRLRQSNPKRADDLEARRVRAQGLFDGFVGSPAQQAKLQEAVDSTMSNVQTIDELKKLGEDKGRQFYPSEVKAQAEVLQTMLTAQLRSEVVGPGAVTEQEWALLKRIAANPTDVRQINAQKALDKLKSVLERNLKIKARNAGIRVADVDEKPPVDEKPV